MSLSVIITTYNWPAAVKLVLKALAPQMPQNGEIIIADDGSSKDNQKQITDLLSTLHIPYQYIWQEDRGFQVAKIRNKAIARANGDYCIFLDGDSIPPYYFISKHLSLMQQGCMVAGNRILLSEQYTKEIVAGAVKKIDQLHYFSWLKLFFEGKINRISPLIRLPGQQWRLKKGMAWKNIKTCNFAAWKNDLLAVNGFDECFMGWGYEDSDLAIRLLRNGIKHKTGKFAVPILHIWHKENDRSRQKENYNRLQSRLSDNVIQAEKGIDQY